MAANGAIDWTEQIIAALRQLWSEGHATAEIGRRLGISKNAVVGKAHRLDLPARLSPIRRAGSGRLRPPPRPSVPKLAEIMPLTACRTAEEPCAQAQRGLAPAQPAAAKPTAESRRQPSGPIGPCCWPLGEPGKPGFRFCEAPAIPGKPYCEAHARSAYRSARPPDDPTADGAVVG